MPEFKGSFAKIKLDVPAYIQSLDSSMQIVLEQAAREWVEAASGKVPVWSGMSRASLRPITRLANTTIVISPLQAKSRIPEGERLGEASLIASFPDYRLTITTSVPHYVIQDDHRVRRGGSPTAPWKSFEAGDAAFRNFIRNVPLPPIVFEQNGVRKV